MNSKILKLDAPYNVIYAGGKDNVRHKGDYTIICNMIAMEFQPVIRRKISMDY